MLIISTVMGPKRITRSTAQASPAQKSAKIIRKHYDAVMTFHTYGKKVISEHAGKVSSCIKFHEYAKPFQQTTPVEQYSNKRYREPPYEENPVHPSKRSCSPTCYKWQEEEKQFLVEYIRTHPPPNPISNSYWRELAHTMNEELQTSRTGASCRSFYSRLEIHVSVVETAPSLSLSDECGSNKECGVQTDVSIPSLLFVGEHSEREADTESGKERVDVRSQLKHLANEILKSTSLHSLAKEIYGIKDLKEEIWRCFMLEIEESSKYLTQYTA